MDSTASLHNLPEKPAFVPSGPTAIVKLIGLDSPPSSSPSVPMAQVAPDTIDPKKGVRLGVYLTQDPRIAIVMWCNACGHPQRFGMAEVIERLQRRGINGLAVGIRELPKYLTRPCPKCQGQSFDSRPDFNPTFTGTVKV